MWGLVCAKFLSDAAWYFYLFWLPKYLYDVRQFDTKQVGYFAWIQAPMTATRLVGAEGFDDVAALPHVSSVVRNQSHGDLLDWATGGRTNVCEVFGSVEDLADLAAARDQIDDLIRLEFDEALQETGTSTAP